MLKKVVITAAIGSGALIISCCAAAALAQSSGAYLEGNLGYGKVNAKVSHRSTTNTGVTGGVNAGYKLSDFVAFEAGFAAFSKAHAGRANANTDNYYFDVAAKGIVPLNNGWDIFAKIGAAAAHSNKCSRFSRHSHAYTKAVALFGAGVDYAFTPNVNSVLQFTSTTACNGKVPSMSAVTLGVYYIF